MSDRNHLTTALLGGCASQDAHSPPESTTQARERATQTEAATESPGNGGLVVSYKPGETKDDKEMAEFLKKNNVLEDIAKYANDRIALPQNVPLNGTSCDDVNAFWNPEQQDITYCYELAEMFRELFGQPDTSGRKPSSREVDEDVIGFTNGALFHELGHGLISLYHLPTTGKEEDAVDQLSVLLLASSDDKHRGYATDTIDAYANLAEAQQADQDSTDMLGQYADEHSLSAQRFYNWACWLYGSDTAAYSSVVETDRAL